MTVHLCLIAAAFFATHFPAIPETCIASHITARNETSAVIAGTTPRPWWFTVVELRTGRVLAYAIADGRGLLRIEEQTK